MLEEHRHGRANATYNALDHANMALGEADRKKAEIETFAAELQASNEKMRASNDELKVITEEMERMNMDTEQVIALMQNKFLQQLTNMADFARQVDNKPT